MLVTKKQFNIMQSSLLAAITQNNDGLHTVIQQTVDPIVETVDRVQSNLNTHVAVVNDLLKNKEETDNRLAALEGHLAEYLEYQKKKESEQPFIEVISESFDEKTGIQIKLDWNPAMINYLKRNGYRGVDDDEIIQKYVADLFNDKVNNAPEPIT
jgi:hypothetical protein